MSSGHTSTGPSTGQPLSVDACLAEIARLNGELTAVRAVLPSAPRRKVIAPDFYKGEQGSAVVHHLVLASSYVRCLGLTGDREKIDAAVELLRGEALTWWLNLVAGQQAPATWELYTAALVSRFHGANAEFAAQCQFDDLRQLTTVDTFVTQFESLGIQAGYDNTAPAMAKHLKFKFLRGLKEGIRSRVMTQNPADYDAAKALALQQEAILLCARSMDRPRSPSPYSRTTYAQAAAPPRTTPMELGAIQERRATPGKVRPGGSNGSRLQLPRADIPRAEYERRRREGLCVYCGEKGHLAGACPRRFADAGLRM